MTFLTRFLWFRAGLVFAALTASVGVLAAQTPPSVQTLSINGGSAQRSMVTSIALTFSDDVGASLAAEDLNITNLTSNTAITGAVLAYDAPTRTGIWTFPAEAGKSLPNGNYHLFIRPADVVGAGGQLVPNTGTTTWSTKLFRYFGDFDGDRDVDFLDTAKFRKTHNKSSVDLDFNAAADADGDTDVDADDLAVFQPNYLSILSGELPPPTVVNPPVRTTQRTVTLSGTAAPGTRVVISNGFFTYEGLTDENGNFSIVVGLLTDRINYLFVGGEGLTTADPSKLVPVTITQDSMPPFVHIDFPVDHVTLALPSVTVTGRVGDTLSGFTGMSVQVNGLTANVTAGIGPNGTYEAKDVPLVMGENIITVTARDILGTAVSKFITVNRIATAQIEVISGNDQSVVRNTELPQPLVVRVKDTNGLPFADKIVNFEVKRSDGRVNATQGMTLTEETMMAQSRTNAQGLAQVFWRLGSDAGKSNNILTATSAGIPGEAMFRASALCRPATQINVGMGNNQVGEAGAIAPLPLTAWVSDDLNGCENIPVTFTVTSGDATVNGGPSVTLNTDSSGHIDAILKFGPTGGPVTVEATHAGNQGVPAVFISRALVRTPGAPTIFKAVVQDNTGKAIGGATCTLSINGIKLPAVISADDGTFTVPNVNPGVGFIQIDGRTATKLGGQTFTQVGRYPSLVYRVNIVPNAENALPVTVYLPTLNPANERAFDGTQDLELTIQGIAGLKMRIKAGSMTLSNGTKPTPGTPVTVSLNQVHADNIPMPIQDGVAPLLTWTLQPPSAKFNPPVEIEYPNMTGLAPGAATNFLSYNHDIERFEVVASATVSSDGSVIKTDTGTGLTSSGWGCNCPPYASVGECANCGVQILSQPKNVCLGENVTISALGTPSGGTFYWSGGGSPSTGTQSSFTTKFESAGSHVVSVNYYCEKGQATDSVLVSVDDLKITDPVNNPSPSNSTWRSNFSFLGNQASKIKAKTNCPSPDIEWEVAVLSPGEASVSPATGKGAEFEFAVALDADACVPLVNGTRQSGGSRAASTAISLSITAKYKGVTATSIITQDERDVIRQEYSNHGLGIPARSAFNTPVNTAHFSGSDFNTTPYSIVLGTPWNLAETVRSNYNRIIKERTGSPTDTNYGLGVNSGWRNPEYNEAVNGVCNSNHQLGDAIDMTIANQSITIGSVTLSSSDLWAILREASGGICERRSSQVPCDDPTITHVHVGG
ncbi:MAG: hypothetical protein IPK22_19045 [Verrucomicrobiaceae bacterium]|nr:hypothetical protein [Verrucomicrobiaceae bacterium]